MVRRRGRIPLAVSTTASTPSSCSAPAQVLLSRIETRTNNPYGKTAAQRELMLGDVAEVEPRLPRTCTHEIDATRPLADVVTQLAELGRDPSA